MFEVKVNTHVLRLKQPSFDTPIIFAVSEFQTVGRMPWPCEIWLEPHALCLHLQRVPSDSEVNPNSKAGDIMLSVRDVEPCV